MIQFLLGIAFGLAIIALSQPRKAGYSEGELCDNNGSMFPFAATREDRIKNNDPRLSLEERYPHAGDRAATVEEAAKQLARDRLLLDEDVKLFTGIN